MNDKERIELRRWCLSEAIRMESNKPVDAKTEGVYASAERMFNYVVGDESNCIEKTPTKKNCPETYTSIKGLDPHNDVIGKEPQGGVLKALKEKRAELPQDTLDKLAFMGKLDSMANRRQEVPVKTMEFNSLAEVAEYFNNYNKR